MLTRTGQTASAAADKSIAKVSALGLSLDINPAIVPIFGPLFALLVPVALTLEADKHEMQPEIGCRTGTFLQRCVGMEAIGARLSATFDINGEFGADYHSRLIPCGRAELIFLPKYSPDLNATEQVFSKLKHLLRKIAVSTVDHVFAAIGRILGAFSLNECANYSELPVRLT